MDKISLMKKNNWVNIIKLSFNIYRSKIFIFLKVILIYFLPVLILSVYSNVIANKISESFSIIRKSNGIMAPPIFEKNFFDLILISMFLVSIFFLLQFLFDVSICLVSEKIINNKNINLYEIFFYFLKKIFFFISTYFIMLIIIVIGIFFILIPALILFFVFIFVAQSISLEDSYNGKALSLSFKMFKKDIFNSIILNLLYFLVNLFLSYLLFFVFNIDTLELKQKGLAFLISKKSFLRTMLEQSLSLSVYFGLRSFFILATTTLFINIKNLAKLR